VFWWPFTGVDFPPGQLPEVEHPVGVIVLFEAIGIGCLVWAWRAFGMADRATRDRFLRTGQLSRTVLRPPTC